ncbi:exonuclease [Vibrio phage D479]
MSLEGFFKRKNASNDSSLPVGVNLVDFSQIILSSIMGAYKPEDRLDLDMIRHITLNTIRSNVLKNRIKYPHVILCLDNSQGGYWRKKHAWYYKFKRKEGREKSGWDFETIFEAIAVIREELAEFMPYVVMDSPGIEADDHIGILTDYFVSLNVPVMITSSDGDFTQCHTDDPKAVIQWSPIRKEWVKPKHGSPRRDMLYKCIKGDKKDGIAAMKSPEDHWTLTSEERKKSPAIRKPELEAFLSATDEEIEQMLSEDHLKRYKTNRFLLDFNFIPEDIRSMILAQYKEYKPAPKSKMFNYFASRKLEKLIGNLSEF